MTQDHDRKIGLTGRSNGAASAFVRILASCAVLGFGAPSTSHGGQDCIGLYFDASYSNTCLQDSAALFTTHEAYLVIKNPSVQRAISGYELSLHWDGALHVTLGSIPEASINFGQFPQIQVTLPMLPALPVSGSMLLATLNILPSGAGSVYIDSYYRPSIPNCTSPIYVDADDPGHLVELQQCEGGGGAPVASILSAVCPEPPPDLPAGQIYAGDQGIVYYHGEELSPPWIFTYDEEDTLRLNGRPVVPQPRAEGTVVTVLDDEEERASVKRESCLKSAMDAFLATASPEAYEQSLRACDGDDLVSIAIDHKNGYPRATIVFASFDMRLIVPLQMPTDLKRTLDPVARQDAFVRHFLDFMRKSDRCVAIGRGWNMWTYEDVAVLRRAVSDFVQIPACAEAAQGDVLQRLSRYSVLRDMKFQEDLRRRK